MRALRGSAATANGTFMDARCGPKVAAIGGKVRPENKSLTAIALPETVWDMLVIERETTP